MKILNLFAGLGGNRKTWNKHEITAVEMNPGVAKLYQELYPNDKVIVSDYEDFLRNKDNNISQYDFLWASPPCPTHSHMQIFTRHNQSFQPIPRMDQIIGLIFWLNRNFKGFFVVENVVPLV